MIQMRVGQQKSFDMDPIRVLVSYIEHQIEPRHDYGGANPSFGNSFEYVSLVFEATLHFYGTGSSGPIVFCPGNSEGKEDFGPEINAVSLSLLK